MIVSGISFCLPSQCLATLCCLQRYIEILIYLFVYLCVFYSLYNFTRCLLWKISYPLLPQSIVGQSSVRPWDWYEKNKRHGYRLHNLVWFYSCSFLVQVFLIGLQLLGWQWTWISRCSMAWVSVLCFLHRPWHSSVCITLWHMILYLFPIASQYPKA